MRSSQLIHSDRDRLTAAPPLLIALCGKSGAGKTTVADYLAVRHGFFICGTGVRCRQLGREFFGTEAKAVLNHITDAFRSIDPGVWLKRALRDIPADVDRIVIDSLRLREDCEFAIANGFEIWRIDSPLETRLKRLGLRGQEYDPLTDEYHPAETALDGVLPGVIIDNSRSSTKLLCAIVNLRLGEALRRGGRGRRAAHAGSSRFWAPPQGVRASYD